MIDDSAGADGIAGAVAGGGLAATAGEILPRLVVASGEAAPAVASLSRRCGEADVEDLYSLAEADGLVDPWPGDEPAVTLSPLGAERLGVRLSLDGSRWVAKEGRAACQRRRKRGVETVGAEGHERPRARTMLASELSGDIDVDPDLLDTLPDPDAAEAWRIAARAEASAARMPRGRVGHGSAEAWVPAPSVLLGQRLQWPAAPLMVPPDGWHPPLVLRPVAICRGCKGRPRPHEYCLVCDRYGRGWMLPHVSRAEAPKAYTGDGLEGGRGRKRARVKAQGCR